MENKSTNKNKLKWVLLLSFPALVFVLLLQKHLNIIKERELDGYFSTENYPALSFHNLNTFEFQERMEKAFGDRIGFHNTLVRFRAQLFYSLFKVSTNQFIIIGKNNYLYLNNYVDAYTGYDHVPKEYIDIQVEKAKVLTRELKKKNIDLLFALAPGKGSYCSEFIPDQYKRLGNPDSSDYVLYKQSMTNAKLNLIDLRGYFLKVKDTVKYPLFSQVGVHWGQYACYIAADTIVHYVENLRHIQMKDFSVSKITETDDLISTDLDAAQLMNTLTLPAFYKMPSPTIVFHATDSAAKPRLLTIADSYFSNIVATKIIDSVFGEWNYWIYNNKVSSNKKSKTVNLKYEIEKRDVILILATDGTLHKFPYGFIEEAYELYAPKNKAYYDLENRYFQQYIKQVLINIENGKAWKKQLVKAAKQKGISEMDEFLENALWLYKTQKK